MAGDQFSLVWNSFPTNLSSGLYSLLSDEHLVDVTLAAEGKILRAHRLILSVCSTYFRDLFKGNNCKHPIVILKDVNYRDLSAMLQFMYQGEVNIQQEDIASFLKVAETLQIKGLTKDKNESKETGDGAAPEILQEKLEIKRDDDISDPPEAPDEPPENYPQPFEAASVPPVDAPTSNSSEIPVSSSVTFQMSPERHFKSETEVPEIQSMFNENYPNVERISSDVEPLDFTSDTHNAPKDKPLDYRYGMGSSTSVTAPGNLENDGQAPIEGISYQSDYGEEPPGLQNESYAKAIHPDFRQAKSSKGRRTVKGIPQGILPLETTLRVVSELGPTLKVERGKVVRMYSCPWCLRHFTRKENLKLHVRYIHGPLESLTCKLCGNKYKNSNSLRVHSYLYHNAKRSKHSDPRMANNV